MKKNLVKAMAVLLGTICLVLGANAVSNMGMTDEQLVLTYLHEDGRTSITKVEIEDSGMGDEYVGYIAYEGNQPRYYGSVLRSHAEYVVNNQ